MKRVFQKNFRAAVAFLFIGVITALAGVQVALAETTLVTLKNGQEFKVETVDGLPKPFRNDSIRVQDLGVAVRINVKNLDAPPYVRVLKAELLTQGEFSVTVTTPLDHKAVARFEASGPGEFVQNFFPKADYPRVWEGFDQPGIHWFPFHFRFEDNHSEKQFEFTQWAQMDYKTWKPISERIEKEIQQIRATVQKKSK